MLFSVMHTLTGCVRGLLIKNNYAFDQVNSDERPDTYKMDINKEYNWILIVFHLTRATDPTENQHLHHAD